MRWLNSWKSKGEPRYDLSVVLALGLTMWILAGPEDSATRAYYAVIDLLAAGLVVASALSDGQRRDEVDRPLDDPEQRQRHDGDRQRRERRGGERAERNLGVRRG